MLITWKTKIFRSVITLTGLMSMALSGQALADTEVEAEPILALAPQQCVALTQGQTCYVDATLTWQLPAPGNYCLYSSQQSKPLMCWRQKRSGRYNREFASDENIEFSLMIENGNEAVATQQLKVTWVHQKKGQPRMWWRIF